MSIDRYDPIRVLGEGSFGKVYLMRDKVKRNFVCVKIIKIKNIPKKEREATKLEVDLLKRLNHPNIVGYVDSFLSKNQESLCICMEYCDGGDLASQIKAAKRNLFSESKILHWFVQLALGLHYMHGNRILHRDLKTQNVFLLGNGRLVLGDLGISKVLDGTMDFAQTCIGTPYYMSPEIFKNKPYSYKSDVWALGCILYELTTLNHAFDANSLNGLATKIVKGKYPPISNKYSKHLRDLITQMLMLNPQQRPDVDQVLRKPFIKKHIVNFFVDIYSRPSASIGEGTMILKAAAGGGLAGGGNSVMNDQSMINFRHQLQSLEMMDLVQEALRPKEKPQDDQEAIRQAKEQASALKREQEHKKMVEAALEKLRQERELRNRQRGGPSVPSAAAAAGPSGGSGGSNNNNNMPGRGVIAGGPLAAPTPSNNNNNYNLAAGAAARRANNPSPSPSNAAAVAGGAGAAVAAAGANNVNNRRNDAKVSDVSPANANVRDRGFNWDQRPIRGAGAGAAGVAADYLPPPRYDDVSSVNSNNSNNNNNNHAAGGGRRRSFEDAQAKAPAPSSNINNERDRVERDRRAGEERRRLLAEQEAAANNAALKAKQAQDEQLQQRRREEAKLNADNLAKAKLIEAENERLRMESVREKAEQASRARRDNQRERERERQRSEIEQLKKDKLELDRRTQEREKMREDRRVQEQVRLDAVRRDQLDVMQEKLDFMNDQIQKLDVHPVASRRNNNANAGAGYVPSMAEEKVSSSSNNNNVDLSARERAYFRRNENNNNVNGAKLSAKEMALYEEPTDDAIGRRSRALAAAQQQQQQQQQLLQPAAVAQMKESGGGSSGGGLSVNSQGSNNSNRNSNNRYNNSVDPAPQVVPGEFSPPPVNRYGNNYNNNHNIVSTNSDSDEEDLFVAKQNVTNNVVEEEEDLVRREEELRAELNFATMRCEELKRTLQETKSFLGPRLPTRGNNKMLSNDSNDNSNNNIGVRPMAPLQSVAALVGNAGLQYNNNKPPPRSNHNLRNNNNNNNYGIAGENNGGGDMQYVEDDEEEEDDEDDFLTEDEYEEDFEEAAPANNNNRKAGANVASNNNNNNRGGFSIHTDFDDDNNSASNNNNPDRTLPRLRAPMSAYGGGLQDMPSPSGKLSDRIERLRQRCKEALGERIFWEAYNFLKQHELESQGYDNGRDLNDDDYEARKMNKVRSILGERKEHYVSLIDQLIFMEDAEHD